MADNKTYVINGRVFCSVRSSMCRRKRPLIVAVCLVGVSAAAGPSVAAPSESNAGRARDVWIVIYNQYLGADIVPLLMASAARFNATLLDVLAQVARNRFRARAERQAELIAKEDPDLVGLQEVWDFACRELPPSPGACAEPRIRGAFLDQLQVTLDALRSHRAPYMVAAQVKNFDTAEISVPVPGVGTVNGLPFTINGKNALLLVKDRDVILRRWNVPAKPFAFVGCMVSQQGCNYVARLELPLPALPGVRAEIKRGFVAVDAMVRGQARRFAVTHLEVQEPVPGEPQSMAFQAAQAVELIARLAAAPLP